jgi:hypothetical protein
MFSFLIIDELDINPPQITKFHYEVRRKNNIEIEPKKDYEFWTDKELEYISKVDLSTPLEDDEDYTKW